METLLTVTVLVSLLFIRQGQTELGYATVLVAGLGLMLVLAAHSTSSLGLSF
jgi:hypothetical protein